uniref:PH domain-containing protein n=1 Tax=Steinernema glaseri TaxID=37863 RepID=A0A1I8AF06_9BILA
MKMRPSSENTSFGYLQQHPNKKLSPQSPTFVRIGVQTRTLSTSEVPEAPSVAPSVRKLASERAEQQTPILSTVKEPFSSVSESAVVSPASSSFTAFSGVKLRSVAKPVAKEFAVNNNQATEDFRNSAVFKRISRTNAALIETDNEEQDSLTSSSQKVQQEEPLYKYEVVNTIRETAVVRPQVESSSEINEPRTSPVKEVPVQPKKTWKVHVNTSNVPILTPKALKMPEIRDSVPTSNGLNANQFKEESAVCKNWNPAALINKLYEIDYMPRQESKRSRFINMEGHLDIPVTESNRVSELEKDWKRQYFRTKEGRLQWFVTHFADEHPVGDVLLAGCDIDANREDGTLSIHGGRDHTKMVVKVPLSLFDKWRQAFLSHAASSILDSYVQPIARPLPHMTEKVVIIELGSSSIRGGVLTMDPSLPQSFFPAIGCVSEDGAIVVGADALRPEVRAAGQLVQPIPATDPAVERYNMNKPVVRQCLQKVVDDLQIDPRRYKVLLSLPQNIPSALIGDLMKSLLNDVNFQSVSVTRQPSLILYSYDVTTGVVVDIGERLNIVPVIDGYVVENAIVSLPYGAQQIRESLRSKLSDHNMGLYSFQSPVERLILRYVMEETCYVATDYAAEAKKCSEDENAVDVNVSLQAFDTTPEMQSEFKINSSRFVATEGLFKPKRWGLDSKALHELVNEAVQLSPIDSRRTLFRNIYLSGGTSLLAGLAERLEVELTTLVPSTIHVQVHMSPWRYHSAFLGAQIVASSTQFDKSCVNKDTLGAFLVELQSSAF